jgi:hypothetical protein
LSQKRKTARENGGSSRAAAIVVLLSEWVADHRSEIGLIEGLVVFYLTRCLEKQPAINLNTQITALFSHYPSEFGDEDIHSDVSLI